MVSGICISMRRVDPETGKTMTVKSGRFGPYVSHDGQFKSIPRDESVFDIALERAVALLKEPKVFNARGALKVLGKQIHTDVFHEGGMDPVAEPGGATAA